jgi:hypothetical protein
VDAPLLEGSASVEPPTPFRTRQLPRVAEDIQSIAQAMLGVPCAPPVHMLRKNFWFLPGRSQRCGRGDPEICTGNVVILGK